MERWQFFSLIFLYVAVIGMAVLLVANRHQARQLFVELQTLEKERDRLNSDWSRLKLEQSTQLHHLRIEQRARESLKMQKPSTEGIGVIRE
ncbi:MAG: cell division protein FtsL [Thiofilum sp.]|uniref:cell division protein FtsL n=1 Tax=Thiofilum sp. TaxID=2212733 RepID=UPI0025E645F8|nr:cell division protein FtsL [Thiofilum sp.]MBK8453204.1 cell division protein FtsL [Thiofilum sp.]